MLQKAFGFVVLAVAGSVSAAQPAVAQSALGVRSGAWMIRDEVSQLDGRKTLQAVVFAKGHDPAKTGNYGGPSLIARCRDGQLLVGLMGFGWSDDPTKVLWRSAGGAVVTETWEGAERMLIQPSPADARLLLGALTSDGDLVVRAGAGAGREAIFSVQGVEAVRDRLEAACPA